MPAYSPPSYTQTAYSPPSYSPPSYSSPSYEESYSSPAYRAAPGAGGTGSSLTRETRANTDGKPNEQAKEARPSPTAAEPQPFQIEDLPSAVFPNFWN